MVNISESLLSIVTFREPKALIGFNQKVSRQERTMGRESLAIVDLPV